jgi:monoamine oxidase
MFHNATKLDKWEKQFATSKNPYSEKRKYLIELLAKMFLNGDTKHPDLQDLVFSECSFQKDEYIRSGFQSNTKPGTFGKLLDQNEGLEAFYRDEDNLIFAGSEYSDEFASYMEGAIRSARKKVHR